MDIEEETVTQSSDEGNVFFFNNSDPRSGKQKQKFTNTMGFSNADSEESYYNIKSIKSRGEEIEGLTVRIQYNDNHIPSIEDSVPPLFILFECNRFPELWTRADSFIRIQILTPFKLLIGVSEEKKIHKYIDFKIKKKLLLKCGFKQNQSQTHITNDEEMMRRYQSFREEIMKEYGHILEIILMKTNENDVDVNEMPDELIFNCGKGVVAVEDLETPIQLIHLILIK